MPEIETNKPAEHKKIQFYNSWWFKHLFAPIIVGLVVGLVILYFQYRSSNKQKDNLQSIARNRVENSSVSGDIVGRDKIIYQTKRAPSEPADRKRTGIKNKLKKLYGEISVLSDYPIPKGDVNALQEYERRVNEWVSSTTMWIEINIGFGAREKFLNRGEGGHIWSSSYEDRYNKLMLDLKGHKIGLEELIKSDEIWFEIDKGENGEKIDPRDKARPAGIFQK